MVFTSDGSRKKNIDTRIGKANAVLRELYCSVVTKREISNTAKFSNFISCGHLRWPMKNRRQRWDICEEFSVRHFVTKSTGLKSVKPSMSTSHFSESRDPNYVSSAMCPECSRKEWWNKSFGLQPTPTGKRPRGRPRTRWSDYISDFAWSCLGVEPEELSEISVDREIFRVLLGLHPPQLSPKENRAQNWVNQWVCRPTLKLSIYEIVFSLFAKSECRFQLIKHICTFLWKSVISIRHRRENGVAARKPHHDTLLKPKKHCP